MHDSEVMCRIKVDTPLIYLSKFYGNFGNQFIYLKKILFLDVFHWSCLDKYASELPPNTAPAGYCCPKCKKGIFTPDNIVGPVVNVLREKLQSVKWSRVGLGQPIVNLEKLNLKIV